MLPRIAKASSAPVLPAAAVLLLLLAAAAAFPARAAAQDCGPTQYVSRSGAGFSCAGRSYRFVGVNVVGLSHFTEEGKAGEVGEHLRSAHAMGVKVIRIFLPHLRQTDTATIKGTLRNVLQIAHQEAPEIKFIVALTNFYLSPFYVLHDDASSCSLEGAGSFPEDGHCLYSPDVNGVVDLRPEWFSTGYQSHFKGYVQDVVKEFSQPPADGTYHPAQIFAWELGNELAILPRAGGALSVQPLPTMISFVQDMAAAIRHPDVNNSALVAPQMVTSGFLSLYHATNGAVDTGPSTDAVFQQLYGAGGLLDFVTFHGYNNEWAEAPSRQSGQAGSGQNGAFLELDWLSRTQAAPYVFEELGFAGATAETNCAEESGLAGGVKYFPGGTWPALGASPEVKLLSAQENRTPAVRLTINRLYDDLGADGVMQWAFNRSGYSDLGDLCRGMDDDQQFRAGGLPAGTGHANADWVGLFDTYSCRAHILESTAADADLYVQSLTAQQPPTGGPVHFTLVIRNGGTASSGPVHFGFYVGPRGSDPFDGGRNAPKLSYTTNTILAPQEQTTVEFDWDTSSVSGELTFAVVVNDDGSSGPEQDRTCNNGFYQDCRIYNCGAAAAPSRLGGMRNLASASVLTFCNRPLADLLPTAITYAGASLYAGNAVLFDSGVRNNGAASSGFNVRWRVDGLNVGAEGGHAGVPANSTVLNGNSQFLWTAVEGVHTLSFEVDSANAVQESNETNNWKTLLVDVPPAPRPDLKPTAIHYDVRTLVEGQEVTFDSGVTNAGAAGSGLFAVRWLIDGEVAGTVQTHPPVAAGETALNGPSLVRWTAVPGTHVVEFVVDAFSQVDEVREDNNVIRVPVTVTEMPRPDLAPTAIRFNAQSAVPGAAVLFDSGVQNLGTGDAGTFNVKWLIDGQSIGAAGSHRGVPAGATDLGDNSALVWTVTPGRHTITFVVDDNNEWNETNEGNNQRTVTVGGPAAAVDLAPTGITVSSATLYAGAPVTFDSGVRNGGTAASGQFNVKWLVDGAEVGAYGRHVSVPAGATVADGNSRFVWTAAAGTHAITFLVDADNEIDETNEGNNPRVITVTVAGSALPDLKPTAIRTTAASLVVGAPVLFDSGVLNAGAGPSPGFNVRWLVDGQPVGADGFHSGVAAGATVLDGNSQYTWIAQAGTHAVAFLVDYDNRVGEVNEVNNRIEVVVSPVAAPLADLRPTAIRVSPTPPRSGDTVLFDSGVQNAGPGSAGPFNVRWLVDGQIASGGTHGGVAAGATVANDVTSRFYWTARPGAHTIGFYIDSDNSVPEISESNNLRTVSVVIEGPQAVDLFNGDMEIHTSPYYGGITGWGPNGGWSYHADFPRPNSGSLGQSFGFYSAGTRETFGQVTDVLLAANTTYTFKSWASPGINTIGKLPYQIGYASRQDDLSSFVLLATAVVSVNGNTGWVDTNGVTYRTGASGAALGKQLIVRFGSGLDGGEDDIWFDSLTLTVQ